MPTTRTLLPLILAALHLIAFVIDIVYPGAGALQGVLEVDSAVLGLLPKR